MAWHNCSVLSYAESSIWAQLGFVSGIAIKQTPVLSVMIVAICVAPGRVFLNWEEQIFKHTELDHKQLRTEKVEHPSICILSFFTTDISLATFTIYYYLFILLSSVHVSFVLVLGQWVPHLTSHFFRSHGWMLWRNSALCHFPKQLSYCPTSV